MLEDVRRDVIASFLLRNSSLTDAQLDTIMASMMEGTLEYKRGLREKGKVSKGAFARTLSQGQKNIESSVYTLLLASYLNLISSAGLTQFSRTTRMLAQLRELEADRSDLLRVIEAMQEFVRSITGKRKVIV